MLKPALTTKPILRKPREHVGNHSNETSSQHTAIFLTTTAADALITSLHDTASSMVQRRDVPIRAEASAELRPVRIDRWIEPVMHFQTSQGPAPLTTRRSTAMTPRRIGFDMCAVILFNAVVYLQATG